MWEGGDKKTEPDECKALTQIGQTGTFRDSRDGSVYNIARLKDGKCWMTQNLRIVNKTISSSDSDMEEGSFTIPTSDISSFRNATNNNNAAYYANNTSNGAYYTYYTATAGTGTDDVSYEKAPSSICPKGWHLPAADALPAELNVLFSNYNSFDQLIASPLPAFTRPNYVTTRGSMETLVYNYSSGSSHYDYTYGYYWSSVSSDSSHANGLGLSTNQYNYGTVNKQADLGTYYKPRGYSVRCVADGTPSAFATITFKAGNNIDGILITDTKNGITYDATPGNDAVIDVAIDTKLSISVIPKANNILESWSRSNSTGILDSSTLLNTNYTVKGNEILTANGIEGTYPYIQETSECATEGTNVTDKRDGKAYVIAKLADGRCWMTQNLRLGDSSPISLNSETSDLSSSYELPAKAETSEEMLNDSSKTYYLDPAHGGYYKWETMVANNTKAEGSICPSGYRPPMKKEYDALVTAYNNDISSILQHTMLSMSGRVKLDDEGNCNPGYLGKIAQKNVDLNYWASTGAYCGYHYVLGLINGTLKTADLFSDVDGNSTASLRCIKDTPDESYQAEGDRYGVSGWGACASPAQGICVDF